MPEFQFQEMFPAAADTTPTASSPPISSAPQVQRQGRADGRARGADPAHCPAFQRHLPPAAAGPSPAAAQHPRRRRGVVERQVRGARAPEERQHRRRRRAADVPGHRHRDRHGQEGPGGVDRRRRRGGDRQGRLQDLHRDQPALQQVVADLDVQGSADRHQPAGADRHLRDRRRRLQVPVRRQGRRLGQQELPLPADAGGAERGLAAEVPRHPDPHPRHRGLPALPPCHRDRRHLGRDQPQDGEARLDALPRRPAERRQRQGRRDPRPRAWSRRCSSSPARWASARSSAASISATTCA